MSYEVRLRRTAQKQLDKLTGRDYEILIEAISALEQEPRPLGVRRLAESGLWRIRAARYRIVYAINDKESLVVVVRVVKRREDTYRGL